MAYLGPSPTKTKAKKKKKKASKKSNEQYLSKATKKTKAKQPLRAPRGLSQGSAGSRGTDDDLARQTDQGNHISIQIGGT